MSYRSNAAEAWYPDPQSTAAQPEIPLDLLPPASLTQPLWRSLAGNLRDTFAPEKLPPLELTSRPLDVGLLLGERLRLPWFRTVFTNIGDGISPETRPALHLTAKPILDIIPKSWILLPLWSEVVDTPKVFYPDKPKPADAVRPVNLQPVALPAEKLEALVAEPTTADLLRDIRRSRIRQRIWIGLAAAQILYMAAMALGKL